MDENSLDVMSFLNFITTDEELDTDSTYTPPRLTH